MLLSLLAALAIQVWTAEGGLMAKQATFAECSQIIAQE